MKDKAHHLRWRLGICAALAVTLLSMIPQANFWRIRGNQGHGTFYSYHPDEYPYAAYVNALILGRPRRNDPYTGRTDQPNAPLPESIFSIQFVPAYAMAVPARIMGLSAATVFILLTPLVAFASGLVLFWLVGRVTGDEQIAATAVLFVLCLGALARGQFLVERLGGLETPPIPFPFLRRYEPALPFPFFFLFCLLLWIMLSTKNRRVTYWSALGAGLTFAVLVFSYYFLWTAAAALLVSLVILWVVIRPEGYRSALGPFALAGGLCLLTLLPYAVLLSHRAAVVDTLTTLLAFTRTPDLLRPLSVLCIGLLVVLAWAAARRRIDRRDRTALFTAALAIAPLLMFNQQVVTGRSLQPIHYEQFIANYISLLALLLTAAVLVRGRSRVGQKAFSVAMICISLGALGVGLGEARLASTSRVNTIVDDLMPAASQLSSLATPRTISGHATEVVLVLYPVFQPADALPSVAPQSVLWAPHSFSFSTLSPTDHKERYFQQLYYAGTELEKQNESSYGRTLFRQVFFGWDRAIAGLSPNWRPISVEEEQAALREYAAYVVTFDRNRASHPTLSYAITSATSSPDLSRVDRWYERDAGERFGQFIIYRLKLRS